MKTNLTARNIELGDRLRSQVERKLRRLDRITHPEAEASVELIDEQPPQVWSAVEEEAERYGQFCGLRPTLIRGPVGKVGFDVLDIRKAGHPLSLL